MKRLLNLLPALVLLIMAAFFLTRCSDMFGPDDKKHAQYDTTYYSFVDSLVLSEDYPEASGLIQLTDEQVRSTLNIPMDHEMVVIIATVAWQPKSYPRYTGDAHTHVIRIKFANLWKTVDQYNNYGKPVTIYWREDREYTPLTMGCKAWLVDNQIKMRADDDLSLKIEATRAAYFSSLVTIRLTVIKKKTS